MGVRSVDQGEAVAGELLLGAADHLADAVDPVAGHHRVQVAGVLGDGLRDELAALVRVGLVPHVDVALDGLRRV